MSNTINKNATLVFRVDGSDESKQQIDKLRTSLEAFGDEGKKVAQPVTDALTNIGREFDKLAQKESEGKNITQRELGIMVQQYKALQTAIVQAFGSLEAAPADLQKAYAAAGQKVDEATEKVRSATAAVKNHASEVSEAGARWGGFKEAIKDAFPQLSSFIAKAGEIGGAFGAGLAIGQQFNAFLKTDMSEWNSLMEQTSTRANAIIRAIADELVAIGVVMKDVITFNIQDIGRDTEILKQTTAQGFKTMKEAVSDTGTEWDKYAKTIGVATESGKAAAETAAKLAEEKRKLSEELKKVVLSLQQENIELQKQKLLKEDSEIALVNETSNLGYYKRNLDETSASLAEQNRKVEELTAKYGANDPVVTAARDKQQQLEAAVRASQQRYDETKEEVSKYESQLKSADAAIKSQTEKIAEQSKEQKNIQGNIDKVTVSTGTATDATEKHGTVIKQVAPNIVMYRDEQGKLHIETKNVAAATKIQAEQTQKVAEAAEKAAPAVKAMATANDPQRYAASAEAIKQQVEAIKELTKAAKEAAAACSALQAASAAAAGGDATSGGGGGGGFSDDQPADTSFDKFTGGA
jgi:chromosome segregation ATPase